MFPERLTCAGCEGVSFWNRPKALSLRSDSDWKSEGVMSALIWLWAKNTVAPARTTVKAARIFICLHFRISEGLILERDAFSSSASFCIGRDLASRLSQAVLAF